MSIFMSVEILPSAGTYGADSSHRTFIPHKICIMPARLRSSIKLMLAVWFCKIVQWGYNETDNRVGSFSLRMNWWVGAH